MERIEHEKIKRERASRNAPKRERKKESVIVVWCIVVVVMVIVIAAIVCVVGVSLLFGEPALKER